MVQAALIAALMVSTGVLAWLIADRTHLPLQF